MTGIDWNAVCSRIDEIATTLEIPQAEANAAKVIDDAGPLAKFAAKYGQSIDWIVLGDRNHDLDARKARATYVPAVSAQKPWRDCVAPRADAP